MEQVAGWVAPIAISLAAMITAANLGARITGYGFVIFLVGSIAWSAVGYFSDQPNLLWQNVFLCVVNMVGIWRWLGRQARYDDGAAVAATESATRPLPSLFPASRFSGAPVRDRAGATIAQAVEAMTECEGGRVSYLVVSEGGVGGVGERLHALRWRDVRATADGFDVDMDAEALSRLPVIDPANWPAAAPAYG